VGVVSVESINRSDTNKVLVAKYQLSPGNALATFSGGGIELAENWIKADSKYLITDTDETLPDLSGLSCRWEPLATENGVMLSMLVQAKGENVAANEEIYRSVIKSVNKISANRGNPMSKTNMKLNWPPRGIRAEIEATVGRKNRFLWAANIYINSLFQWLLDTFDLTAGGYRGKQYRDELRQNTDYQRFDDTLRILIDCSSVEADKIDHMLDLEAQNKRLVYGLHRADSALMTCLVFDLDKSEHIHFVDGSNGGFTSAAKALKAKL